MKRSKVRGLAVSSWILRCPQLGGAGREGGAHGVLDLGDVGALRGGIEGGEGAHGDVGGDGDGALAGGAPGLVLAGDGAEEVVAFGEGAVGVVDELEVVGLGSEGGVAGGGGGEGEVEHGRAPPCFDLAAEGCEAARGGGAAASPGRAWSAWGRRLATTVRASMTPRRVWARQPRGGRFQSVDGIGQSRFAALGLDGAHERPGELADAAVDVARAAEEVIERGQGEGGLGFGGGRLDGDLAHGVDEEAERDEVGDVVAPEEVDEGMADEGDEGGVAGGAVEVSTEAAEAAKAAKAKGG